MEKIWNGKNSFLSIVEPKIALNEKIKIVVLFYICQHLAYKCIDTQNKPKLIGYHANFHAVPIFTNFSLSYSKFNLNSLLLEFPCNQLTTGMFCRSVRLVNVISFLHSTLNNGRSLCYLKSLVESIL